MTDEQRFRIIGDYQGPESFIPSASPRDSAILLDVARRMRGEWTPEELADRARSRAEHAAERQAKWARDLASHEHLLKFATHPTLTLLLEAHGPHIRITEGQQFGPECHACPGDFDDDGPVHPVWPCPTWLLIEKEGA